MQPRLDDQVVPSKHLVGRKVVVVLRPPPVAIAVVFALRPGGRHCGVQTDRRPVVTVLYCELFPVCLQVTASLS